MSEKVQEHQDTTMDRFESVTNIGQRAADDDAHRVIEIGLLHLLFEAYGQQFLGDFSHKNSQFGRDPGIRRDLF